MSPSLVLTYLMTYGGAALSLYNPFYGFLVYVSFAILKPEDLWFYSVPQGSYSRIVGIALLFGWVIQQFRIWRERHPHLDVNTCLGSFFLQPFFVSAGLLTGRRLAGWGRERAVVGALLGFLLLTMVGSAVAFNQTRAWNFVEAMAKIVLPFFVGISNLNSVTRLKQLAWTILISMGYVALEMNYDYYAGYNRLREEGFGGMDNNCAAIALVTIVGLGFFLGMGAEKWWHSAIAFGSSAFMAHGIMFSNSRGGMLGLLLAGAVSFYLIPKKPRHYVIFALAALLCVRLAGEEVRERFFSTFAEKRDDSAESRVQLWSNCIDAMSKHPLLGVGPDHWPLVVHEYGWNRGKEAHTLWLQMGAEVGLPALCCLLFFFGATMVMLWPVARERVAVSDPWLSAAARMVIASLVGFCVAAQFVSLKTLEHPYYVALLGAGVLRLVSMEQAADPVEEESAEEEAEAEGYESEAEEHDLAAQEA
jgi:O-antigen ligase